MVMNDSVFADVFNAFVFEGKKMVDPGKMYDASRFYSRAMLRELRKQYPEDEAFDVALWKNATVRTAYARFSLFKSGRYDNSAACGMSSLF